MTDIASVLGSMASLIVVTYLGYVAARLGFLSASVRPALSGLIFNITLPCTILASVGEVDASSGGDQIAWSIILGFALFFVMLAAAALACLVVRPRRDERNLYLFMGVLTNTGFIGFAVLESIFGGGSVFLGSIFIAVSNVFLYSIGIAVLTSGPHGEDGPAPTRRERVRTVFDNMLNAPLVVSLIAMVVFFTGISVPTPIMQAADMAGGVTSPLAMMLVGLSIADADLGRVLGDAKLWVYAAVRFLVVPLAVYVLLAPVVPSRLALGVFIVMLAMPTGSMAGPIAGSYGQSGEVPARGTIVSTITSFAIVPILCLVMGMG